MRIRLIAITAVLLSALAEPAAASTILTFNITGIANFQNINQGYGDNVSAAADAIGSYGTDNGVYTPNITLTYGAAGEDLALWTTGFGDLTNIMNNDADGDTTLTTRFTAAAGFQVNLIDFDIASFVTGGQTIAGARVLDGTTNAVLWSVGSTLIAGGANHVHLTPNITAAGLVLEIDLTGLGSASDDIGLDNIRFAQSAVNTDPPVVPEPATLSLLGLGLVGMASRVRRSRRSRAVAAPRD